MIHFLVFARAARTITLAGFFIAEIRDALYASKIVSYAQGYMLMRAAAKEYTARYSATFVDGSAVGPVDEGTACEAPGLAALESFLIELVPKAAVTATDAVARAGTGRVSLPKSPARAGRR